MSDKPSEITSPDDLQDYYWLKSDLMTFCKKHGLPKQGGKSDLIKRIRIYLSTGHRISYKRISKDDEKDSLKCITKNTLVKNYNNDAETRKFFVKHLGEKFKFNAYLRQFTDPANIPLSLTYGGLVEGWITFENSRKNSSINHGISPQFEYNQFIRDFFNYEKEVTIKNGYFRMENSDIKKGSAHL